jgi:NAD(P)-dependent dehydrogenase (short-subunit alcohol dehydrogenase family)
MDEKVIVITGASSGIGAFTAEEVAKRGHKVVLAARRADALEQVAERIGEEAFVVPTDVTSRQSVEALRDAAIGHFGHVDVWINNAGRGLSRAVLDLTDADFDEMMLVNVKSALYGMQAITPHFQSRRRGHIINVNSMLGRLPLAGIRSAYNAAKHALTALTANLRIDLRDEFPEITVSTVFPGVVATDFGKNALGGGPDSRKIPNAQPVEEVGKVIANLIEHPRAEVYTRPMYHDMVKQYFTADDVSEIEAKPPFAPASASLVAK